jgi:hypothetical protein
MHELELTKPSPNDKDKKSYEEKTILLTWQQKQHW